MASPTSPTPTSPFAGGTTAITAPKDHKRSPSTEFIRRFLLHVTPSGFHRIRSYGLLANSCRAAKPRPHPSSAWRHRPANQSTRALPNGQPDTRSPHRPPHRPLSQMPQRSVASSRSSRACLDLPRRV
ncbi:MAG: transposase [Blastocatellia bacterium]|nr:transposase [Blastocatellia bacterium]